MRIAMTLLIVVTLATSVRGGDSLPSDVQAALDKNAALFSNILIVGERSRRFLAPAKAVLKTVKTTGTAADFTQSLRFELRFQGPLFRESIEYLPGGNVYTQDAIYETSYDGAKYILGYKRLKYLASSNIQVFTPRIATEWDKARDRPPDSLIKMKFWYLRETGFSGPQKLATLGQPVASVILEAAALDQIVSVSEVADSNESLRSRSIEIGLGHVLERRQGGRFHLLI